MDGGFVQFRGVTREYSMGDIRVRAVAGADISIAKGEFVVIAGPSGAGKTTVLNLLGGMDCVTEGQIFVDGQEISAMTARSLTHYRRHDIGFVFQFYNLIQNLTALENVELAAQITSDPADCRQALVDVGLEDRLNSFPSQLSGGEQQRVAIARALAKNPKLLLCDEPTGALDYQTGKSVLKLLQDTCRLSGKTVIVITHNMAVAPMANRVIRMKNGAVADMTFSDAPRRAEEIEW